MSSKGWKKYSDKAARSVGAARVLLIQSFRSPGQRNVNLILSDGKSPPRRFLLTLSPQDQTRIKDLLYTPTSAPPEATRSQVRNLLYHGVVPSSWKSQED